MCGRYTLYNPSQKLANSIAELLPEDFEPSYNISPGTNIITRTKESLSRMHWGLRTPQNFHINARLESADSTPRFRESWEAHRCLIPANGFYEWLSDGVRKQPYYISSEHTELLYFAGLWMPATKLEEVPQCVILTTCAQERIKGIHERMPVMLPESVHQKWLDNYLTKSEAHSYSQKIEIIDHTVSNRVNSIHNNDNKLILPTTPLTDDQLQLL